MLEVLIAVIVILLILFWWSSSKNKKLAAGNLTKGAEFLSENSQQKGIKITSSGLQYKVIEAGAGVLHPVLSDRVKVHYHGTLIDGTVFDSSVDRGESLSFGLNQVIKGWTEGLQLMVVGGKTRLFIPSNLAYGNRSAGKIEPGSVLIFDVHLLGINE